MKVVINSYGGYTVIVQGTAPALHATLGNPDAIPLSKLSVRESGTPDSAWQPLTINPLIVTELDHVVTAR